MLPPGAVEGARGNRRRIRFPRPSSKATYCFLWKRPLDCSALGGRIYIDISSEENCSLFISVVAVASPSKI